MYFADDIHYTEKSVVLSINIKRLDYSGLSESVYCGSSEAYKVHVYMYAYVDRY